MAARRKKREAPTFPEKVVISMGGPKDSPYLTLHKDGYDHITQDTVVGVYVFKRKALVTVKRKLTSIKSRLES